MKFKDTIDRVKTILDHHSTIFPEESEYTDELISNLSKPLPTHIVVTWPEVQKLMDLEGFDDNSNLINNDKGLEDYGSSAYFVDVDWLYENL